MRTLKFRGCAMGGSLIYGLLTVKKLRSGAVVPAIMTKPSGKLSDTIPVLASSVKQFINGQWEPVEYTEETFNASD